MGSPDSNKLIDIDNHHHHSPWVQSQTLVHSSMSYMVANRPKIVKNTMNFDIHVVLNFYCMA